jgi:Fe-S cluster biogenesis protein NfuA/nitrite reductase/ring-hydroxylating ferredoxin subunit
MAARVETLLAGFDATIAPRRARENAEELVRTVVGLYGSGLERVLSLAYDVAGDRGDSLFDALCADRFVESLLVLHDLHPYSLDERVARALDSVRPYLKSHEGGVEIVRVEDGIAYLRLEGSCEDCPSSAATVKLAVERAILERVPEIREVRAEGALLEPGRTTLRLESDWVSLATLPDLTSRGFAALELAGTPVLLLQAGGTLYAYRNRCASCRSGLADATFEYPRLVCSECGRVYDVVRAGRADGEENLFIEPFPIVRENGRVRVAIPIGT